MPRDPEEKARFRGDDKAYAEGWERIFGNRDNWKWEQTKEESEKTEKDEDEKE